MQIQPNQLVLYDTLIAAMPGLMARISCKTCHMLVFNPQDFNLQTHLACSHT
jgi:hypothetical protein